MLDVQNPPVFEHSQPCCWFLVFKPAIVGGRSIKIKLSDLGNPGDAFWQESYWQAKLATTHALPCLVDHAAELPANVHGGHPGSNDEHILASIYFSEPPLLGMYDLIRVSCFPLAQSFHVRNLGHAVVPQSKNHKVKVELSLSELGALFPSSNVTARTAHLLPSLVFRTLSAGCETV